MQPDDKRVSEFADYLIENYIDNESRFPPRIWASHTVCTMRTTNTCESFHSKFNSYCPSPHPNIHVFMHTLINIQTDSYIKINSVHSVNQTPRRNIRNRHIYLEKKVEQYKDNLISRVDFVKCCSYILRL